MVIIIIIEAGGTTWRLYNCLAPPYVETTYAQVLPAAARDALLFGVCLLRCESTTPSGYVQFQ